MNASADQLNAPLGMGRDGPVTSSRWMTGLRIGTLGLGSCVIAIFAAAALFGDPEAGLPVARSEITARKPESKPADERPKVSSSDPGRHDAQTMETDSGVSVVRGDGSAPPTSVVVRIPDDKPQRPTAGDPALVETSRSGPLPRIGADGAKPVDVYARPAGELPSGVRPIGRIAIVVGGLGISRSATDDAIAHLPEAVSLAFAPYGDNLEPYGQRARAAGHEILLQVPMEPFDYPDSDPGPHTLKAGAKPRENLDHLQWAMGRLTGYIGIMNYMGAKLTADERALTPLLRELGQRGLAMVDDGSSSRSLVASLAAETKSVRADMVLDPVPRADLIDRALEKLETQATSSSRIVVASASALPVTIERLARWARSLEARGILLVPVSAALGPARQREIARQ